MTFHCSSRSSGFLLIEVLTVAGIIGGLSVMGTVFFLPFLSGVLLESTAKLTVANLRWAQQMSRTTSLDYEIDFDSTSYSISEQAINGSRPIIRRVNLPKSLSCTTSKTLGFKPSGNPKFSGSNTLTNAAQKGRKIIVAVGTGRVRSEVL